MRVEDVSTMRHDDASYTCIIYSYTCVMYHVSTCVMYCIVSYEGLRMDVYFPLQTFRFLACIYCLFHNCMFGYVYMLLYSMYSTKGGNKEYLSKEYLF